MIRNALIDILNSKQIIFSRRSSCKEPEHKVNKKYRFPLAFLKRKFSMKISPEVNLENNSCLSIESLIARKTDSSKRELQLPNIRVNTHTKKILKIRIKNPSLIEKYDDKT